MAKIGGISGQAKLIVGISVALLIWAILGYGVGVDTLFGTTVNASTPAAVKTVATLGVSVVASIAVMLGFFE
jgi:hypothetical protein